MAAGHIYILLNSTMPGYLKIGMTTRSPEERARELSQATGVAVPYTVAYSVEVANCEDAESMVQSRLAKFRINRGREFFHLPLRDAIRELSEIADAVGHPDPNSTNPALVQLADELTTVAKVSSEDLQEDVCPPPSLTDRGPTSPSPKTPTEQELVDTLRVDLQRVYLEMRQRVMAFGPHVETYATGQDLKFKAGKVFAEIGPRKACLSVLIRPEGFNIPEKASANVHGITVTRIPDKHGWPVTHKFVVDGASPMDEVERLLKQSYNAVVAKGAG